MKDWAQEIARNSRKPLEERKRIYTPVAQAYVSGRPKYPASLIQRIIDVTHLSPASSVLEVGSGPATATMDFASQGCSMRCVEPNLEFCRIARNRCAQFPNVEIENISFEEWPMITSEFDAVLAANSFHWIAAECYQKASDCLRDNGYLILLWNMMPQPATEVDQLFARSYERYAPHLYDHQDKATQKTILNALATPARDSGLFAEIESQQLEIETIYTAEQYLMLLESSLIRELDDETRNDLLADIQDTAIKTLQGEIKLSYLSAFNLFKKK